MAAWISPFTNLHCLKIIVLDDVVLTHVICNINIKPETDNDCINWILLLILTGIQDYLHESVQHWLILTMNAEVRQVSLQSATEEMKIFSLSRPWTPDFILSFIISVEILSEWQSTKLLVASSLIETQRSSSTTGMIAAIKMSAGINWFNLKHLHEELSGDAIHIRWTWLNLYHLDHHQQSPSAVLTSDGSLGQDCSWRTNL